MIGFNAAARKMPLVSAFFLFISFVDGSRFDAPSTLTCYVGLAFGARGPLTRFAVWCC